MKTCDRGAPIAYVVPRRRLTLADHDIWRRTGLCAEHEFTPSDVMISEQKGRRVCGDSLAVRMTRKGRAKDRQGNRHGEIFNVRDPI